MDEYSRIIIERYCMSHSTKKSEFYSFLVEMSYDLSYVPDDDTIFQLDKYIKNERNQELKEALIALEDFLMYY